MCSFTGLACCHVLPCPFHCPAASFSCLQCCMVPSDPWAALVTWRCGGGEHGVAGVMRVGMAVGVECFLFSADATCSGGSARAVYLAPCVLAFCCRVFPVSVASRFVSKLVPGILGCCLSCWAGGVTLLTPFGTFVLKSYPCPASVVIATPPFKLPRWMPALAAGHRVWIVHVPSTFACFISLCMRCAAM